MTAWTTPTHVSAGEADSGKFNTETVDNLLYLKDASPIVRPDDMFFGTAAANPVVGPIIQGGSVVDTTSVGGRILVQYPTAFPTGVISIVVCNGNDAAGGSNIVAVDYDDSDSLTGFYATWRDDAGALVTGVSRRVNWIAIGW